MGKELIRNGGLERGDMSFWDNIECNTVDVSTVQKHSGTYSLRATTSTGTSNFKEVTKDYISVNAGAVYRSSMWLYNDTVAVRIDAYIRYYDSNKTLLTEFDTMGETVGTGAWEHFIGYSQAPAGAVYARIEFWGIGAGGNEIGYIDEVSLQEVDPAISGIKYEMIDVENELLAHTVYGKGFFAGLFKEGEYMLDVASYTETVAGGTCTLQVTIQGYDYYTDNWSDLVDFTLVTCPSGGNANNTIEKKTVAAFNGWLVRVKYVTVENGTCSDLDFKVGAVLK